MTEPLLARLVAQGHSVAVAALPWVAPVYRAMPRLSEVIVMALAHGRLDGRERWRIAASLRGRFDAAFVLPNSLKAALVPWLARIPVRIGYSGEGRVVLLNRRLRNPIGRPPMVGFYSALARLLTDGEPREAPSSVAPLGSRPDRVATVAASLLDNAFIARHDMDERPQLQVDAAKLAAVTAAHGLRPKSYLAFAPGAEYGPAKRWPAAHYEALARTLHARCLGPVVLLGSAAEAALCDDIARTAPAACRVLAGRVSLDDAIVLIAGANALVSNDSGLMHVAAAFEVPQVAIFGSTSPGHTPPLNPRAEVLWLKNELKLDCMPCYDRVCRYGHTRCLTGVSPERVEAAFDLALARGLAPT